VALRWPDGYSVTRNNAISDLGVTTGGRFDEGGGAQVREVWSPWRAGFNGALVFCGALIAVGALLMLDRAGRASLRSALVAMTVAGGSTLVVGLAPWDVRPGLHDNAALAGALAQWLAMAILARAAAPSRRRAGAGRDTPRYCARSVTITAPSAAGGPAPRSSSRAQPDASQRRAITAASSAPSR
jgi:hypothetical membrane protein